MATGCFFKSTRSLRKIGSGAGNEEMIKKLIKKLEEIGGGDYIVLISGSALNDIPDSIMVISISGNKSWEEIRKDFKRAFEEKSSLFKSHFFFRTVLYAGEFISSDYINQVI